MLYALTYIALNFGGEIYRFKKHEKCSCPVPRQNDKRQTVFKCVFLLEYNAVSIYFWKTNMMFTVIQWAVIGSTMCFVSFL